MKPVSAAWYILCCKRTNFIPSTSRLHSKFREGINVIVLQSRLAPLFEFDCFNSLMSLKDAWNGITKSSAHALQIDNWNLFSQNNCECMS